MWEVHFWTEQGSFFFPSHPYRFRRKCNVTSIVVVNNARDVITAVTSDAFVVVKHKNDVIETNPAPMCWWVYFVLTMC